MEKGNILGPMEEHTKEDGKTANCMDTENTNGPTVVHTKAIILMIKSTAKVFTHGLKVKNTMAVGVKINNTVKQRLRILRGSQEEEFGIWDREKVG